MTKTYIPALLDKTRLGNKYSPLVEAIFNSLRAIKENSQTNGEVIIDVLREGTISIDEATINPVIGFEVFDNGVGINDENKDSFDTIYTKKNYNDGGKGFGRLMYLKFFNNVRIESVYQKNETFQLRKFNVGREYNLITDLKEDSVELQPTYTKVFLNGCKKEYDKHLEVIARKILEQILTIFIINKESVPNILLRDNYYGKEILINDYYDNNNEIIKIKSSSVNIPTELTNDEIKKEFIIHLFKNYYSQDSNKIYLVANDRTVTQNDLKSFIPEFEEKLYEQKDNSTKSFVLKVYLTGTYLDNCVTQDRDKFNFEKEESSDLYPFSKYDLEKYIAEFVKSVYSEEIFNRSSKKRDKIKEYIDNEAPWYRGYENKLNLDNLGLLPTNEEIDIQLHQIAYKEERNTKITVKEILELDDMNFNEELQRIVSNLTDLNKNELAKYVSQRKLILALFKKAIKRYDNGKVEDEKIFHEIVFPMNKDSTQIKYMEHNLWLLDERLVFSELAASDRKINKSKSGKEPDLLIFDKKNTFRAGDNEFSNPLTIFKFKKPKRANYNEDDDPIKQIHKYVNLIKMGKYETPDGIEKVKVSDNTPIYGIIVCDIVDKIKEFAKSAQLTISADGEGFYGFHSGYGIYYEIMSYSKLLKDATQRNKIFFKKLGIDTVTID